ncbi:hypothetical protein Lal_00012541 [Lupinus albus]|uniref:2-oxoglutarate-dependent dioxygenase DAO n=1 Tax=Lupinus albus TaxID=3870 RepID=A0A6A5NBY6_LUPAL|nr:putative gibberellin 3-beta-dioxygenase [Lupinus albus]KAF1883627.1 hypothetical protein Lal_00012541 [Lupinus albus]
MPKIDHQVRAKDPKTQREREREKMNDEYCEKIPCVKFCSEWVLGLEEEESEEWRNMSKKVREACERYGCFILTYDDDKHFPKVLREDMFMGIKALFDLPKETKLKHKSTKAYRSYNSDCPIIPLCQSFGIDDAPLFDTAHAFTNLMWPQGNPPFCETMKSTSSKMLELSFVILKMIVESYGLPKQYISHIEELKSSSNLRMMKYKVPDDINKGCESALLPHTDKCTLTILCQNEVQGLQVLTKTGKWIQLDIPFEGFVVLVGDTLQAWSNGRVDAATHRVMMSGEKERYSFGVFAMPKEEVKIEVPSEFVDENTYPLRYRPFIFGDYFNYFVSAPNLNALDMFAAV